MNQKYFKEFSDSMRERRVDLDITPKHIVEKTRLKKEWIASIENGDFDFAPEVYIKGILRQYAGQIRLNPEEVLREYEHIREKIEFIAQDGYVEVKSFDARVHFSPQEIMDFIISGRPEEAEAAEGLEAEVRSKLLRERKINLAVMTAGACLMILCLFYVFFDTSGQPTGTASDKKKETAAVQKTPIKKARWELSEPIFTEQQRLLLAEIDKKSVSDSTVLSENLRNVRLNNNETLEPISVQDAAKDLERRISN